LKKLYFKLKVFQFFNKQHNQDLIARKNLFLYHIITWRNSNMLDDIVSIPAEGSEGTTTRTVDSREVFFVLQHTYILFFNHAEENSERSYLRRYIYVQYYIKLRKSIK